MSVSEELGMSHEMPVRRDVTIVERHIDDSAELIKKLKSILKTMKDFCNSKKNMYMGIRRGL